MAEATKGYSRVIKKRRWDDYASLKQYHQNHITDEVIISGWGTTANAEFQFSSDTINYIAAEGQCYILCEADDAGQHSKYVYIEYQDDTGAVRPILTADLHAANSTTVVPVTGATDFYRLRQMISEVESATGGGKAIVLSDAVWGGADDTFGFIEDGNSQFILQRFFVQPSATAKSYLGRVTVKIPHMAAAAAVIDGVILTVAYTPKILSINEGFAEPQVKANITTEITMNHDFVWEPLFELEPATEVTFSWNHTTTGQTIWFEAIMFEVYL